MATFPTLTPSSRTFTPGRHPHSEIRTLDGLQARVRTSNVLLEQRLRLTFVALTETQMLSVRSHYNGQQGRFLSFAIPDSLLSGMATPASFTPTGYSWIYASTPQIEDIGLQRYTVSIELVTVPPEGANISGGSFALQLTFQGGAGLILVNGNATGCDLTITVSFQAAVINVLKTSNAFTTLGTTSFFFNPYGYEFTVGARPLVVYALGCVTGNTTERVRISRTSTNTVVASADISSNGIVGTQNITPVTLEANTQYTIWYQHPSNISRNVYKDIGGPTFDPAITLNRYVFGGSSGMPTSLFGGTGTTAARFIFSDTDAYAPGINLTVTLSFVAGQLNDTQFNNVSLLLHMNGANGSTTFTDSSSNALTITRSGDAQISTAQSKFGGASGAFDGSGDYISFPYSALFAFAAGNFTIEMWLYRQGQSANYSRLWGANGDVFHEADISIDPSGVLGCYGTTNGTTWNAWAAASIATIGSNTWTHIALVRNGGTVTMYVNGTGTALTTTLGTTALTTGTGGATTRTIGSQAGTDRPYFGYIDEVRVTKGFARYTANFTPPTAPFLDS